MNTAQIIETSDAKKLPTANNILKLLVGAMQTIVSTVCTHKEMFGKFLMSAETIF